jgi:hypothetical protein
MRYFSFKDSNMVVRIAQGKVNAIGIFNPAVGPVEYERK